VGGGKRAEARCGNEVGVSRGTYENWGSPVEVQKGMQCWKSPAEEGGSKDASPKRGMGTGPPLMARLSLVKEKIGNTMSKEMA